ncbi:MAG TPA: transposase [Ktedonobacteraceae bacterium]|nr:transposase [Ktedonobacteraceae bacterium]
MGSPVISWPISFPEAVLNPAVLVDYRESLNVRSKTDALDAFLLARYAKARHPRVFQPLSDEILQLRSRICSRQDLMQMRIQETNRLHAARLDPQIVPMVQEHVSRLTDWQQQIEARIQQLLSTSDSLRAPWEHLQTIPGIGWYAAACLIAHLGEIRRDPPVGAVVSLAGLSVRQKQSGRSVHQHACIDRHGRQSLRSLLYLCAMAALRASSECRSFQQRMLDARASRAKWS